MANYNVSGLETLAELARLSKDSWCVYILKCTDGTFYTGITTDINRRIKEHGTKKGAKGSCRKSSPAKMIDNPVQKKKQKGGGTTKTCLPASKIRSMSKSQRQKLVNAKKSAGAKGKYRRSSKTNVKGARKKGATLRDWFEKEDWRRVDDPSKKCGE